ncbi:NADAR family protein [Natronospirillum operosum]|uniref:NADAR family protein n=1 Tax=Natronospirillum operosum TaxID=2759953 RepID=A0A4Z0WC28_9GAMM|nr:NADAR family protein [Natronospirillum operosum]TGG91765.1 NADAR family protein [Natronospirillum operosum]
MPLFESPEPEHTFVQVWRLDPEDPLGCTGSRPFELDGYEWPTAEHYYQAMKYPGRPRFQDILQAPDAKAARKIGRGWLKRPRPDWKQVRLVMMTRALYIQLQQYGDFTTALLDTGDKPIREMSQYDYFWGRGRDQRGHNHYGRILMDVRRKLRES